MPDRLLLCSLLLGLIIATQSAHAETYPLDEAIASLKDCVESNLAQERARGNPDPDRLLVTCRGQFQQVLRLVPDAAKEAVREHIRADTGARLRGEI